MYCALIVPLAYETALLGPYLFTKLKREMIQDQVKDLKASRANSRNLADQIPDLSKEQKDALLANLFKKQTVRMFGGEEVRYEEGSRKLKKLCRKEDFITSISLFHNIFNLIFGRNVKAIDQIK